MAMVQTPLERAPVVGKPAPQPRPTRWRFVGAAALGLASAAAIAVVLDGSSGPGDDRGLSRATAPPASLSDAARVDDPLIVRFGSARAATPAQDPLITRFGTTDASPADHDPLIVRFDR